jgi:selenide,water dikinase
MKEAGVTLIGGHSIDDAELKYGLSVTGAVHPDRLVTNAGAKAGDKLILTKPLGTGIISTALKAGKVSKETEAKVTKYMAALNKKASELMQEGGVHACTDITGFGLIGHACQLAQKSRVGIKINSSAVPVFAEVEEFARAGLCPGGLHRNREFYGKTVEFSKQMPDYTRDILFDPQTSGGLLISLSPDAAELLVKKLHKAGIKDAVIVGEVINKPKGKILIE